MRRIIGLPVTIVILLGLLTACSTEPEPIRYGSDLCALCKMVVSDARYGAELVTTKGKKFKFDSAECLVHYLNSAILTDQEISGAYVTNYNEPETLIEAKTAFFLVSENLPSPMGENLTAVANKHAVKKLQSENPGEIYSWDQLRQKIRR